jgi:dTDP-4-amino-4,6-dideoxygalactose transaminase
LANLENFVCRRNEIAKLYESLLEKNTAVSTFKTPSNIRHSYYKYPIRLHNVDRMKLSSAMKKEYGIDTGTIYYPPCHLHPWYKENFGIREGDLPVSETVLKQVLCLPMHPGISKETARYVVDSLKACISKLQ